MSIAFAKRVRRYSDHALPDVDATMGTAPGYVSGGVHGRRAPGLRSRRVSDGLAAEAASADLGIAECTGSADEPAP